MTDRNNKRINIMIIGLGNHARRIYVPVLKKYESDLPIKLISGVELIGRESSVDGYLRDRGFDIEMHYVPPFNPGLKALPLALEKELDSLVKDNDIQGVIISTEPLVHKAYAKWAIKNRLNILMDKPVALRQNMVSAPKAARGLVDDYQELLQGYEKEQSKKETIFSINVQRRFEPGFQKVFDLIKETKEKFNIPVTSIQAQHADGVWIFPKEILQQQCHPYNQGYGKCSHSGYHIFDIVWQLYKSGMIDGKRPEAAEVISSFVQPSGLLTQFNQADYRQLFGQDYESAASIADADLHAAFKNYGENDAFCLMKLFKGGDNICNISINLLHNSFSRRSSAKPGSDLYKGNGRTKAQSYFIQQGPFQCIQIHNYQSDSRHDDNTEDDYLLGGNNHFEIYVFRNAEMYGPEEAPFKVYNIRDLIREEDMDASRLYYETVKERVILEFINFLSGKISKSEVKSNIDTHEIPIKIMSAAYQSHIRQQRNKTAGSRFSIDKYAK